MATLVLQRSFLAGLITRRFCLQIGLLIVAFVSHPAKGAAAGAGEAPLLEPLRRLGESEFRLTCVGGERREFRFSPDGKLLAGANLNEVRIWSFPDGKLVRDFSNAVQSRCIAFGADGSQFLAFDERNMEIYRFDISSGKLIGRTKLADVVDENGAITYSLSEDGRWLCYTEEYGHVGVWDTSRGKRLFRKDLFKSFGLPVSSDGVLALWNGSFLERYDVTTGEQLSRMRISDRLIGIVSNAQGTLLAGYSPEDMAVIFFNPEKDERVGAKIPVEAREWRSSEAALSANGRRIVFSVKNPPSTYMRKMAVFDVETGVEISRFDPPAIYYVDDTILSPDGHFSVPIGGQSAFCVIDNQTGKPIRDVPDHTQAIEALSFTPDSKTLLVGSRDKRQAWNVDTGTPGTVFEQWYHTPYIAAVDDHRVLISGLRHGGIQLQDIETGAIERQFEKDSNIHLSSFQLSTDRKSFVGIGPDREGEAVRRWDIDTGSVVSETIIPKRRMAMHRSLDEAIQGLALGGSRLVRLEQTERGKRLPDGSIDWGRYNLILEDWTTREVTNRLPIPQAGRFKFANTEDGSVLAVVVTNSHIPPYGMQWGSTYLLIWDIATETERLRVERQMENYFSAFQQVAVTSDVRLAATSSLRDHIELWNALDGERLHSFTTGNDVTALAFSDDGAILASGHQDGSVYLWDTHPALEKTIPQQSNQ